MTNEHSRSRTLAGQANLSAAERRGVRQALGAGLAGLAALVLLVTVATHYAPASGAVLAFLGP